MKNAYDVTKGDEIGWVFKHLYHPPSMLQLGKDLVDRQCKGVFDCWIKEDGKATGFVARVFTQTPTMKRIYFERLAEWFTFGSIVEVGNGVVLQ